MGKVREAPHQPQKRAAGWQPRPQAAQATSSATPQFVQNLPPGALSLAQLAHCMTSSLFIRHRNANVAGMLLVG
jgi:hypothetical protein